MKIIEAIERIDSLKPNTYTNEDKIKWLSTLDSMICQEIMANRVGEPEEFKGYSESTDMDTELLAKEPHDDIYIKWLQAQIDYANEEYGKYNNAMTMFNAAYSSYSHWYIRTHITNKGRFGFKYF